jgi:hypothetical protein
VISLIVFLEKKKFNEERTQKKRKEKRKDLTSKYGDTNFQGQI